METPPVTASLIPAARLSDEQLRSELADTHRLAAFIGDGCSEQARQAMSARLSELDEEYLSRFPAARARWPWAQPVTGNDCAA